jgi:hypothetical protein
MSKDKKQPTVSKRIKGRVIDPVTLTVQETLSGFQLWYDGKPILLPNGSPLAHPKLKLVEHILEEFSGFGTVTLDAAGRVLKPEIISSYVLLGVQKIIEADPIHPFMRGFGKWLLLDSCLSPCAGPEQVDQMARWSPLFRYFEAHNLKAPQFPQSSMHLNEEDDVDSILRRQIGSNQESNNPKDDEYLRNSKAFVEFVDAEFRRLGPEEQVVMFYLFQCHHVVLFPLLLVTGQCTVQEYTNGLMAAHCFLSTAFSDITPKQHETQSRAFREDAQVSLQFLEHARVLAIEHQIPTLDHWFETLPFPLASILRAWQATPSQDFKTKYGHLLHFFEAAAEFVSVILLSAFNSNEAVFAPHRQKLMETMGKQNLSFNRATFGTWKLVVEYLGKQTRDLLNERGKKPQDAKNDRVLCADMFADPSLSLPNALSRKELATIFSATNKMRNDWGGHGGVVGQAEAESRNQQLLAEVQKLREAIADIWVETRMILASNCRPRRGMFEMDVAILMGSNSDFIKETRAMDMWLDVETLYLSKKDSSKALKLLPLIQVGPSPQSAKNACYFFSRLERDGARFISYHFTDKPELTGQFADATEAINLLTGV